jgi:hypothetical protein
MKTPACTCAVWVPVLHMHVRQICGPDKKTYVCAWCRRSVPWCFGADNDMPLVCDDCWAEAHA